MQLTCLLSCRAGELIFYLACRMLDISGCLVWGQTEHIQSSHTSVSCVVGTRTQRKVALPALTLSRSDITAVTWLGTAVAPSWPEPWGLLWLFARVLHPLLNSPSLGKQFQEQPLGSRGQMCHVGPRHLSQCAHYKPDFFFCQLFKLALKRER